MTANPDCKGCAATVRLAPGEVERLLAVYLQTNPAVLASDETYSSRLAICAACPDLLYGTTCRHCGCLVAIRGKLAPKGCPAPLPRWTAIR